MVRLAWGGGGEIRCVSSCIILPKKARQVCISEPGHEYCTVKIDKIKFMAGF